MKAKDPKGVVPTVEKANVKEKKNIADQQVLNKPRNQSTVRLKPKGDQLQTHKEVQERTMFAIIVDFKDTPDPIVIS